LSTQKEENEAHYRQKIRTFFHWKRVGDSYFNKTKAVFRRQSAEFPEPPIKRDPDQQVNSCRLAAIFEQSESAFFQEEDSNQGDKIRRILAY
jgi:hypothetical protein